MTAPWPSALELEAVVDGLVAERYAPPAWWATPAPAAEADDPGTTAARRRALAADYARVTGRPGR